MSYRVTISHNGVLYVMFYYQNSMDLGTNNGVMCRDHILILKITDLTLSILRVTHG